MPHDDIPHGTSHSEDVPFSLYACVMRRFDRICAEQY